MTKEASCRHWKSLSGCQLVEHQTCSHLVEIGPEGADGQFHLLPFLQGRSGRVPHRESQRTAVLLDVDVELTGTGALSTGPVILEYDAVSVVLFELGHEELSLLSGDPSGAVRHHER